MFRLTKDLIIFDVETTGVSFKDSSIIQIGAVRFTRNGKITLYAPSYNIYIVPYKEEWTEEAANIHGLTKKFLFEQGVAIDGALQSFENWCVDPKDVMLAHWSSGFDTGMLQNAYDFLKKDYPFSRRSFDIASIVRFELAKQGKLKKEMGECDCAKALGIRVDKTQLHDGLYDADLSAQMLLRIINGNQGTL
jgi:DNA polymerase III alpha subunit (gram-positive type)